MLTNMKILYLAPLVPTAEAKLSTTTTTVLKRIVYKLTRPRLPRLQPPATTNAETTALTTDTVITYVTPMTVACNLLV